MIYTVDSVHAEVRAVTLEHGEFKSYKVDLAGPEGLHAGVELFQKAASPAPRVGQTLDGQIEQGKYGPKFKKTPKPFGAGGVRVRDPRESAMIVRQHSQDMALQYAAIRQQQGQLPADFSLQQLGVIADWFDADAKRAGEAAS